MTDAWKYLTAEREVRWLKTMDSSQGAQMKVKGEKSCSRNFIQVIYLKCIGILERIGKRMALSSVCLRREPEV